MSWLSRLLRSSWIWEGDAARVHLFAPLRSVIQVLTHDQMTRCLLSSAIANARLGGPWPRPRPFATSLMGGLGLLAGRVGVQFALS